MSKQRDVRSASVAPSDNAAEWRARITDGTAKIVTAYVANNKAPHSGLPAFITLVAQSLTDAVPSQRESATSTIRKATENEIRASIQRDRLISFVDGKTYRTLRRHLGRYGLTPQSYRMRYGLPVDYPMVAPSYSERRTELSKQNSAKQRQLAAARKLH